MQRRLIVAGAVTLAVAAVWVVWRSGPDVPPPPGADGPTIVVEVLNTTGRSGLARMATMRLRERGIDVVSFGNASEPLDSTLLVVRRGDERGAERVRRALGLGRVLVDRDSSLFLDVTVLLGADLAATLDLHP